MENQNEDSTSSWIRTTVVLREEYLEKLKMLAWWEQTTLKEVFNKMVEEHLASKTHLDKIIEERKKSQKFLTEVAENQQ